MTQHYLDIETTGLNPEVDEIITIQYQELERNTGEAIGELKILKAWESSEREILKRFIQESNILDPYPFSFIPVGYNLNFEHNFLKTRTEINDLPQIDILNKPFLDLRAIGIIMNNGEFKGSGLDKLTGKKGSGSQIPGWYASREFDKILEYIKMETREFIKFNSWLYGKLPRLLGEFRGENGLNEEKGV